MIKVRIRFKRKPSLRFLSHLDQLRLFQRALRRAKLPVAYSNGFNPHPQISFANAMSVGMISEDELVDIGLDLFELGEGQEEEILNSLQRAMPDGIEITEVEALAPDAKSLTKRLVRADYEIEIVGVKPEKKKVFVPELDEFNAKSEINIEKRNKKGHTVQKNIRDAFDSLRLKEDDDRVIFQTGVLAKDNSLIKPDLIVGAFMKEAGFYLDPATLRVTRKKLVLD